jgi:energy-coupling factor transport system permease protein
MSQGFSLYLARDSGLHRLHPLTKLSLAATLLVAAFALPGPWSSYAVFLLVLLPLAAWGRILPGFLRSVARSVLPFALSLFLIQGLLWPGGSPVARLGPLSLKAEGLAFALASTGRILMIVSSFLLLALSTRPDLLMIALAQRGFPSTLSYIVVTTIQIVPYFQGKARAILDAQRSRGLETEGGLRRRLRALLPLVVPLVLSSILDIEERAIALEARAFGRHGTKTSLQVLSDSRAQSVLRWAILALAPLLLVAGLVL